MLSASQRRFKRTGTKNEYFAIISNSSGKCVEVNKASTHQSDTFQWDFHGGDQQLWYWEGNCILNKKYGEALDLDKVHFSKNLFGKVIIHPKHGGDNQQWTMKNGELVNGHRDAR